MKIELPGLCDLQVNGFGGIDFNAPALGDEDLLRALAALRATGVTLCLPTLITSSGKSFSACARTIARCRDPMVAGIHMEGPYLAELARGAHPARHLVAPSLDGFRRRQEAADGRIVLVTLAPELPGALALIERLVAERVTVAIGHSAATPAIVRAAVAAGATLSTHLGNGCPRDIPRHPNLIWEQLAADELTATVIVDGHHLAPAVVKVIARAKGLDRLVLVTDATAAAGRPPGPFRLGELQVERTSEGRVEIAGTGGPGQGKLAGSSLTLDAAVASAARFLDLPIERAWALASHNPARVLQRPPAGRVLADWDPARHQLAIERVA
jgi:N-acetylglucosamine-6-phosphate deacetylase